MADFARAPDVIDMASPEPAMSNGTEISLPAGGSGVTSRYGDFEVPPLHHLALPTASIDGSQIVEVKEEETMVKTEPEDILRIRGGAVSRIASCPIVLMRQRTIRASRDPSRMRQVCYRGTR